MPNSEGSERQQVLWLYIRASCWRWRRFIELYKTYSTRVIGNAQPNFGADPQCRRSSISLVATSLRMRAVAGRREQGELAGANEATTSRSRSGQRCSVRRPFSEPGEPGTHWTAFVADASCRAAAGAALPVRQSRCACAAAVRLRAVQRPGTGSSRSRAAPWPAGSAPDVNLHSVMKVIEQS